MSQTMPDQQKKSGIVTLAGRSNVGKSTLLNALVGTKLAIVTPKPQTTRQAIHGVVHDPRGQIVFVDTPGIFERVPDKLTATLNRRAQDALQDVDLILYVVDPTRAIGAEEERIQTLLRASKVPKIMVINKTDEARLHYLETYRRLPDKFIGRVEISAKKSKNLTELVNLIFESLPKGEPFYPEFQLTNVGNKFWFAELIREKVFLAMHQEIPYTTTCEVEEITERENGILYVKAAILTTAPRYRKMIIGSGGQKIKTIGQAARKEFEAATGKKIYLDLEVRVEEKWMERAE